MIQHIWEIKVSWTTFSWLIGTFWSFILTPSSSKASFSSFPKPFPTRTSSASIFLFKLLEWCFDLFLHIYCSHIHIFLPYIHSWKKGRGPKPGSVVVPACESTDQRFSLDSCLDSHFRKRNWRKQGGFPVWGGPRNPIIPRILERGHISAAHSMLTTADPFGGNSFWWTWLIPARSEPITPRWTTLQPLNIFSDCLGWYFSSQTPTPSWL